MRLRPKTIIASNLDVENIIENVDTIRQNYLQTRVNIKRKEKSDKIKTSHSKIN